MQLKKLDLNKLIDQNEIFLHHKRKKTKQIKVGNVLVGGDAPVSVQTMTNTLTHDIDATLEQINLIEKRRL